MEIAASTGILVLLALAAGILWLAARRQGGLSWGRARPRGPAELIQRLPLTAQHSLHLIRTGQESLWVVTFPGGAVIGQPQPFAHLLADTYTSGREEPR